MDNIGDDADIVDEEGTEEQVHMMTVKSYYIFDECLC